MKKQVIFSALLILLLQLTGCIEKKPTAKMDWWKDARFGMFIHWGIYSVPAGVYQGKDIPGIGEWIMNNGKIPVAEYKKYAAQFNPVEFDAEEWVKLAKEAGMRYIVITSKHHDGFALFDSKVSDFDIMDATPFKRDVIGELAAACKKYDMPLGLYYSQAQDWTAPGGSAMGGHWDPAQDGDMGKYIDEKAVPQVSEILNNYGEIKILWWDTPFEMTPEQIKKFKPEMDKHPSLIYNDRLGDGFEGDLETPEQYIPATGIPGKNWEVCMTMNDTWGFKKHDHNWKSTQTLIRNLIDIASKGGNFLLNVGPTSLGVIPAPSVKRLKAIGTWMDVNSEAIYGTTPSPFKKLEWGRCTMKKTGKKTLLYLHIFDMPKDNILLVPGLASRVKTAYALNDKSKELLFQTAGNNLKIDLSGVQPEKYATVVVLETDEKVKVYNGPEILADHSIFIDTARVKMSTDIPNSVIRYTIDGTMPSSQSEKADGVQAVLSESSFVLKAVCFADGKAISGLSKKEFRKTEAVPAIRVKGTDPGLKFAYYEGKWDSLPDFSTLHPVKEGITPTINITLKEKDYDYGLMFKGYLSVPETGVYQFILSSDDGSKLTLAGKTLNHDGLHAMTEKTMDFALAEGLHPVEVLFFQQGGGDGLQLEWIPEGKERAVINASRLRN